MVDQNVLAVVLGILAACFWAAGALSAVISGKRRKYCGKKELPGNVAIALAVVFCLAVLFTFLAAALWVVRLG